MLAKQTVSHGYFKLYYIELESNKLTGSYNDLVTNNSVLTSSATQNSVITNSYSLNQTVIKNPSLITEVCQFQAVCYNIILV